jgi:hypothetical protein
MVRRALDQGADPSVGFLALPSTHRTFPAEIPLPYQEFLREADGAVCGVILLFESDDILKYQMPAKALPGGRQRWFCIGSVEEAPLVLDSRMNAVYHLDPESAFDPDDSLGDLDHFLLTCVFGADYQEFVPDPSDDPWFRLLQTCGDGR